MPEGILQSAAMTNPALNLAPFGRWTRLDEAAQAGEFKRSE